MRLSAYIVIFQMRIQSTGIQWVGWTIYPDSIMQQKESVLFIPDLSAAAEYGSSNLELSAHRSRAEKLKCQPTISSGHNKHINDAVNIRENTSGIAWDRPLVTYTEEDIPIFT